MYYLLVVYLTTLTLAQTILSLRMMNKDVEGGGPGLI